MKHADKNPYLFINNINAELRNPNPFLISLMLSCKFNGVMYTNGEEFVTIINDRVYSSTQEVDVDYISKGEFFKFDKLSLLSLADTYNSLKWFFIEEYIDYNNDNETHLN